MQSVKTNLLAAFRHLLKPIVRLAIKNGVTFPDFSEALKRTYVNVASRQTGGTEELVVEGVSLLTSLPADEVKRTLGYLAGEISADSPEPTTVFSTLLSGWHTDSRYTGPYGVLRDLRFGDVPKSEEILDQFESLVALYCPNNSPKVILDELLRAGCVISVGASVYRAIKRSYIPDPLSSASILLYARVVHNLCEAAEVNLRAESAGGKGLMQRNIYTTHGIPRNQLPAFDKYLRDRGQMFADDIDNWLSDRDGEDISDGVKTGVGVYHYIVNSDDEQEVSKQLEQ